LSRLAVEKVARHLRPLLDDLVFVGGCAAALLVGPPSDAHLRATDDVDCAVSIDSYGDFSELEMRLRELGYHECRDEEAPICRWVIEGVRVDFMPTEGSVLGFKNQWYQEAVKDPVVVSLEDGLRVKVVNLAVFLATKFDAFSDRGGREYYGNSDIEDIIAVLAYRRDAVQLVKNASEAVREFLANEAGRLLSLRNIENIVSGCFEADAASQAMVPFVLDSLRAIAEPPFDLRKCQVRV
jgi:predicted nucleotidyltransferase